MISDHNREVVIALDSQDIIFEQDRAGNTMRVRFIDRRGGERRVFVLAQPEMLSTIVSDWIAMRTAQRTERNEIVRARSKLSPSGAVIGMAGND